MRFTIRDLLLLMLVAALAIGWLVDRQHLADENQQLRTEPPPATIPRWPAALDTQAERDGLQKDLQELRQGWDKHWQRSPSPPND
jgi:hypothetical protein